MRHFMNQVPVVEPDAHGTVQVVGAEFTDGRLKGGLTTGEPVRPGGPLVILYADDLGEAQRRVTAAGGRVSREAFDFPGGRRFHFPDLDGYELAVWTATA